MIEDPAEATAALPFREPRHQVASVIERHELFRKGLERAQIDVACVLANGIRKRERLLWAEWISALFQKSGQPVREPADAPVIPFRREWVEPRRLSCFDARIVATEGAQTHLEALILVEGKDPDPPLKRLGNQEVGQQRLSGPGLANNECMPRRRFIFWLAGRVQVQSVDLACGRWELGEDLAPRCRIGISTWWASMECCHVDEIRRRDHRCAGAITKVPGVLGKPGGPCPKILCDENCSTGLPGLAQL